MQTSDKKFRQQVAVITGAGSGIGFEIARQLALNGAYVVLNDLDESLAAKAVCSINLEAPGSCQVHVGDVGNIGIVQNLVDKAIHQFGKIDMAIANAGITHFGSFFEFSAEDFQKTMDVNLQGAFFLSQAAANHMKNQEEGGRLLLMSSTIGMRAYPQLTAYSMTKAALSMMARSLVLELSPYNIAINAIAPGAVLTERTQLENADYAGIWEAVNPNGKVGIPKDIADVALFLLSQDARHINGQTLVVDGGWTGVSRNP